uniref:Uncharacterized protein n=1 Tax=Rhizophora mucronata TaxID=61149 RepID=A0A2P2QSH4_RHIMU
MLYSYLANINCKCLWLLASVKCCSNNTWYVRDLIFLTVNFSFLFYLPGLI